MEFFNIRFLAVFAVVILHVSSLYIYSGFNNLEPSTDWWVANIFDSMTRWCVPIFIIISGYFLLDKQEFVSQFFKKRASKLIIPIVFWSFFYLLWGSVIQIKVGNEVDLKSFFYPLIIGKPYYHLWYVFMIPFLYFFTPFLRKIIKVLSKKELLTLIFILFVYEVFNQYISFFVNPIEHYIFVNTFLMYLGYFVLGGYFKIHGIPNIKNSILITGYLFSSAGIVYGVYALRNEYFYTYLSPSVVFQSIFIFIYLIKNYTDNIFGLSESLAGFSFGVYLFHPFLRDIVSYFIKPDLFNALIYIPFVSIFIVVVSYVFCFFINKIPYLRKII